MATNDKVTMHGSVSSIKSYFYIDYRASFHLANHALEAIFPRFPAFSVVLLEILELCSFYVKYARDFKNMLAYSLEKKICSRASSYAIFLE